MTNLNPIVCTDMITIFIVLIVAIVAGAMIGYYFRKRQEKHLDTEPKRPL